MIEKGFTQKTLNSYTDDTWFYGNKLNPDLSVRIEKINYTNIELNTNMIEVRISKSEKDKIASFNKELETYFPIKELLKGSTTVNDMKEDYYILRYTNKNKIAYNVDVFSYDPNYAIFEFSFSFK